MLCAFNPRGTSGSGKTTIARAILDASGAIPYEAENKKVRVYRGELDKVPVYVLGSYATTCGGCDTIESVHIAAELIVRHMELPGPGLVVYEGLMISHMIGTVGDAVRPYGKRHVMAFLDTPLDVCLERIRERRRARGEKRPLNTENTTKDWDAVRRARQNALNQGFVVVDIDHTNSIDQSLGVVRGLCKLSQALALDNGEGTGS